MMRLVEVNEALGTARYVSSLPDAARLARTRSFVAWYEEIPRGPDEYGRPQQGTERREVARGLALPRR